MWIEADKKLPETTGYYIVAFQSGGVFQAWFSPDARWMYEEGTKLFEYGVTGFGDDLTVTHWMPLPEHPLGCRDQPRSDLTPLQERS